MKHSVRSTLVTLGLGVLVQRLLQLVAFLCIGRSLGVERLGLFAQGQALAALLAVLAGAGIRNLLARAVARSPGAARSLVLTAVRARLSFGALLVVPAIGCAFAIADQPWFWTLCLLQVMPSAFDLKNLLDAAGRSGAEVLLETGAALLQLVLVVLWLSAGGQDLTVLAGITLASRCVYAAGALPAIAALPHGGETVSLDGLFRRGFCVSLGQTAHELMAAGDVWLVAMLFGQAAAGLYAVTVRIAGAALLPSAQLARLLLPHLLRAAAAGNPLRTVTTALRATLFATLPMVAGGAVVAAPLCALFGEEFANAAPALRLVLLAVCLQHLGWQCSNALFAAGRDAAYAAGMWWPAVLHALLLGAFAGGGNATGAALAMLGAQAAYLVVGTAQLRSAMGAESRKASRGARVFVSGAPQQQAASANLGNRRAVAAVAAMGRWQARLFLGPLAVAAATAAAATVPTFCLQGTAMLAVQLAAGGVAFATSLWLVELRGRLRRVGDGLAVASGFRG